jgi:nudix-type nucleoside diphosphatase (YffH/AdpP family)
MNNRIRIQKVETLSDDWYVLKKTTFEYQRRDGVWQTMSRETYDRGNGATILLYNTKQQTVILTRQFRFPAFVNEHDGVLIEACAGLLDKRDPTTAIQHEAEEETGYQVGSPQKVFEAFMSPGSVTEKLYFFIAEYQPKDKIADGGGLETDGEDIEVLEIPFTDALAMIRTGEIADGKTIMLLQHLALSGLLKTS